jgi:hypothetical protein
MDDATIAAKTVYQTATASQAELNAALAALTAKVESLVPRGDTTELAALVAALEGLDLELYTPASVEVYTGALASAAAVVADSSDCSQGDVDDAYTALAAARAGLEVKIVGIAITSPPATVVYTAGDVDELDLDGLEVVAVFADETTAPVEADSYTVTGYDLGTPGTQDVVVTATLDGEAFATTFAITVTARQLDLTVAVSNRCTAGKAYLTVKVTNADSVPASVMVSSGYGQKAIASLEPTKSASAAFTTRLVTIPQGSVTVTGLGLEGGAAAPVADMTINHPEFTCAG